MVTEVQLNSYLNLTLGPKLPPGISELEVQMTGGGLLVQGKVDLDRVPLKRPSDGFSLLRFVSGVVPVVLSGGLRGQDGQGAIDSRKPTSPASPLPIALVAQLVSTASRSAELPQGFDIHAPFPLPYAMRRVRFEPGARWWIPVASAISLRGGARRTRTSARSWDDRLQRWTSRRPSST